MCNSPLLDQLSIAVHMDIFVAVLGAARPASLHQACAGRQFTLLTHSNATNTQSPAHSSIVGEVSHRAIYLPPGCKACMMWLLMRSHSQAGWMLWHQTAY